jgi:serine protease Do
MRSLAKQDRFDAAIVGIAVFFGVFASNPVFAQFSPPDFTGIVKLKAPAVVAITTRRQIEDQPLVFPDDMPLGELFRRQQEEMAAPGRGAQTRQALGSGFIINPDGYIVTNNHVIENASEIRVLFHDRTNVEAKLVGRDASTDVAVLKIEPRANMVATSWGNSDAIEPGAWTIAIGSPYGLGGTVTVGVLSARSRDIHSGPYDDFLQTDASINQGNSGGPLFNALGEVIGVNTAIFSPTGGNVGIGFAIPSKNAQAVVDQLIGKGRVERGWLGVRLQELTSSIARALGLKSDSGAIVALVETGSPAEKAGIRTGDVVTAFSGQPVNNARDLSRTVTSQKPGQQAVITVYRDGKAQDIATTIGQREEDRPQQTGALGGDTGKRLGLALAPLSEPDRRQRQLPSNIRGVIVQQVEPNSPAAETGIRSGDVIVSANNRDVSQPTDVAEEWAKSRDQKKPILLRLSRDGEFLFVAPSA